MKAKKSYGQHFLKSEAIANRIATSLSHDGYERILEIGPGLGMLSQYLLAGGNAVHFVEADRDMVEAFSDTFPEAVDRIYLSDFLRFDMIKALGKSPLGVIGNFPYNISSQIIFKCIDHVEMVPEIVGMFQLEMAKRIIAPPGKKDYGIISVFTQVHYTGEFLFEVPPEEFDPPPKVMSAVIRLRRKKEYTLKTDPKLFSQIVKITFRQRRKMIRNTLKSILPKGSFDDAPFLKKRPEQLSVDDFVLLTEYCTRILAKVANEEKE